MMTSAIDDIPVTVIPPGKRSPNPKPKPRPEGAVTTKTALSPRDRRVIVCGPQPGPRGEVEDDEEPVSRLPVYRRAATALEAFAAAHQPRPLGQHLIDAGNRYAEIVREYKIAMGFDVIGGTSDGGRLAALTPEQVKAAVDLAKQRKAECDGVLFAVMPGLPGKMEAMAYDNHHPSPYDEGKLAHGLVMLAKHLGLEPRSRMRDD